MPDLGFNLLREAVNKHSNPADKQTFEKITEFINHYTGRSNSWYWYPLACSENICVAAYNLDEIYRNEVISCLESVFNQYGIKNVKLFQMQEYALQIKEADLTELLYKKDEDGYNFPWDAETFYFDDSKRWMIYVSHEGTITFTGQEIVEVAQNTIDEKYIIRG